MIARGDSSYTRAGSGNEAVDCSGVLDGYKMFLFNNATTSSSDSRVISHCLLESCSFTP